MTDLRADKRQQGGRPALWRRAPVFAAGVLPLGAVCAAFIAMLSSVALQPRPSADVMPAPHLQGHTQPSVVVATHAAAAPRSHRSIPRRTQASAAPRTGPSLVVAESSPPPARVPAPEPQPASPTPQPTPSPPAPSPAAPAEPPVTVSPEPATDEPVARSASPPPAPPTPAAPPVTQPAPTPGWGCGDDNHQHTGPPGKAEANSPCDR